MLRKLLILAFSVASGLYVLSWFFHSLSLIHPTFVAWLGGGDWNANFLSWHFLRHEPWSFPLGKITQLGYPTGTSVALTDPTPVFAYLFRPFSHWLPAEFQYDGLWIALCFVLQAVFGVLLLELLTSYVLLIAIGSMLFTLSPILMFRVRHISLCAHWLILAFFWIYFQNRPKSTKDAAFLFFLNFIGWYSHPYLGAVLTILSVCAFFQWSCDQSGFHIRRFGILTSSLIAFELVIFYIGGYLSNHVSDLETTTWGGEPFKLSGLFDPMMNSNFSNFGFYYPDAADFMYLGVGLIALAILAIYLVRSRDPNENLSGKHALGLADFEGRTIRPLLWTCGALTLYALSNKIYWGRTRLIHYHLPHVVLQLFGMFRDGGRFFWPCYYLIIFSSIRMVLKHFKPTIAGAILAGALALQFVEFHNALCAYPMSHTFPVDSPLKDPFWDHPEGYKGVMIFPNTFRVKIESDFFYFSFWAANHGKYITAVHAARPQEAQDAYFNQVGKEIKAGKINPDIIYVIPDRFVAEWQPFFEKIANCSRKNEYFICTAKKA